MSNRNKHNSKNNSVSLTNLQDLEQIIQKREQEDLQELQKFQQDNQDELQKKQKLQQKEKELQEKEKQVHALLKEFKEEKEKLEKEKSTFNREMLRLTKLEAEEKNNFPSLFEKEFATYKFKMEERENALILFEESLQKRRSAIAERELKISIKETSLDEELNIKRIDFEKTLLQLKQEKTQSLHKQSEELLKGLTKDIDTKIVQKKEELSKIENVLETTKERISFERERLNAEKESLKEREAHLEETTEEKLAELKKSILQENNQLKLEIERLRASNEISMASLNALEGLKIKLGGDDPAKILLELSTFEQNNKNLREELLERPTREMLKSFDTLKGEKDYLQEEYNRLVEQNKFLEEANQETESLQRTIKKLENDNQSLEYRHIAISTDNEYLKTELSRFETIYKNEGSRETIVKSIENPYFETIPHFRAEEIGELEWLDNIYTSCIQYGLRFSKRILYAFHTALKTAEWSPLTVLAGVSGTGKSELPKLYAEFGGIKFLNLSVQPNWDSQDAMLGFFNSINNTFEAQPILRVLAQTQKKESDTFPYGLKQAMTLILLDEMNLAHIELYFAEFLSKLESRRGKLDKNIPHLDIKVTASENYKLALGRNVLWAGTINQDETTKALSDKVVDRGIIINFPRPTRLESRTKLKPLNNPAPLLNRTTWDSWWCKESKFNKEIIPYKEFIEKINEYLSVTGRALGHRVWQSIEYYMANYPTVLEAQRKGNNNDNALEKAMRIAFEDQLVQKVMPKLRGIETRGQAKINCLDKIQELLSSHNYDIVEDFKLACEFGYGQFIWMSANYIKSDEFIPTEQSDLDDADTIEDAE